MPESDASRLVRLLQGPYLRNRTAVLLLSQAWLGREADLAARLGISYADHHDLLLRSLVPGQRFLGIGWTDLISRHLHGLASGTAADGNCILVANIDVVLSSLRAGDRDRFWASLREGYRPACGLLLALPERCQRLMSEDEQERWTSAGRLGRWG